MTIEEAKAHLVSISLNPKKGIEESKKTLEAIKTLNKLLIIPNG